MDYVNPRTMVRKELERLFDGVQGIDFCERQNQNETFPKASWRIADRAPHEDEKRESKGSGNGIMLVQGVIELELEGSATDIDDKIDEVLFAIELRMAEFRSTAKFDAGKLKGSMRSITWDGDAPRFKTQGDGTYTGKCYSMFIVEYISQKVPR